MTGAHLAAGRLVRVLAPAWQPEDIAIFAVYPPTRHLSAKVRRFVDFLGDRFAAPAWDAEAEIAARPTKRTAGGRK